MVGRFMHRERRGRVVKMCTHLGDQGSVSRLRSAEMIAKEVDKWTDMDDGRKLPVFSGGRLE